MSSNSTTPQASTLLFFFADKIVAKDSILTGGTTVPCRNQKVQTNQLANMLFAFAFWNLREQGAIELKTGKKKGFIFKHTPVQVARLKQLETSGLEAEILRTNSGGAQTEDSVRDLIYRWFGEDSAWPHKQVVAVAAQEAIRLSYGAGAAGGIGTALKGMFTGKINFEPDCARIAGLENQFDELLSRWQSFQTSDATLCEALLAECKSGINSRVEQKQSDND